MSNPVKINLKVVQGGTFTQVLRWESSTKVYTPITGMPTLAPLSITAVAHGAPVGWRAKVTGAGGMKEINSAETYHTITSVDANTVTFNAINATGYTAYTTGGILEYNKPVDMAGFDGRMQIRLKLADTAFILELTTANGGIVVDNVAKTISIKLTATQTAALTFSTATYSLELFSINTVIPFATGSITLLKEVTR